MLTTWHLLSAQVGNTSPRSGGRSVGIVRSRTQTMEFFFFFFIQLLEQITFQQYEVKALAQNQVKVQPKSLNHTE
jgi:hypothetical protein